MPQTHVSSNDVFNYTSGVLSQERSPDKLLLSQADQISGLNLLEMQSHENSQLNYDILSKEEEDQMAQDIDELNDNSSAQLSRLSSGAKSFAVTSHH